MEVKVLFQTSGQWQDDGEILESWPSTPETRNNAVL